MSLFGKKRTKNYVRLREPAVKGSNKIKVETGLDLVRGDRLALLPTSYFHDTRDDVFIDSYNNETGEVILNSTLNFYHWGAELSTAGAYNGVDMRGEVLLLSRNIKIVGEDVDGWGCQIVTSDATEIDSTGQIHMRYGQTIIDSVEVHNCSQTDTYKSAIRFEGAT